MMRGLALACLLFTWCFTASARAEAPADDDEATATALVEQAAHAYDDNQLDEALRLLTRAYELSPRPSTLYNQAQVLRAKDDCAAALDAYRRFLETAPPDDANRERATRRRDEMQACADQRKSPPPPVNLAVKEVVHPEPPAGVVVSAPVTPASAEHRGGHRRAMRVGGWALVGVGVVAAGAAVAFAWKAHSLQNQLTNEVQSQSAYWSALQPQITEGENDASRAWWCAGLAALAAGGGTTLLILSRGPSEGAIPSATAQPQARVLGFSGTF